jgi:hypothetical protein
MWIRVNLTSLLAARLSFNGLPASIISGTASQVHDLV